MTEILLLGSDNDGTMAHVRRHFSEHNILCDYLDVNALDQVHSLSYSADYSHLAFSCGEVRYDFARYRSIYQRFWPTKQIISSGDQKILELISIIQGYMSLCVALVVNKPFSGYSNGSKFLHSRELVDFGFDVPVGFCTTDPEIANSRLESGGRWITKGSSAFRTRVRDFDLSEFVCLERLRRAPVIFQRRISGPECRLHMLDCEAFPLLIETDCIDYRYAHGEGYSVEFSADVRLPELLVSMCRDYCRKYGLHLAGFDFIQDPSDGRWLLLEVNPSPGFDFYDRRLGGQIASALSGVLKSGKLSFDIIEDSLSFVGQNNASFLGEDRRPAVTY